MVCPELLAHFGSATDELDALIVRVTDAGKEYVGFAEENAGRPGRQAIAGQPAQGAQDVGAAQAAAVGRLSACQLAV
jgi:hypothetical protein